MCVVKQDKEEEVGAMQVEAKLKKEKKEKKKKKKRQREEEEEGEEEVEPEAEDKSVKKKRKGEEDTTDGQVAKDPNCLSNFRISETTKRLLLKRGITSLFPIQSQTFNCIYEKKDLMGRARTGMGKTLAFVLPVVELLLKDGGTLGRGRAPKVVCMAPTRELAKQVASEFESITTALSVTCIYGGASYDSQNNAFRKGIDIVVGTTGRTIDHIERGNLRLHKCEYLILDEADTMLEMGFREDVQKVFDAMAKAQEANKLDRQTLLFSATIPSWVKEVADTYMKKDRVYVNLVNEKDDKASLDVQHVCIPCHWQTKPKLLGDLIEVYAPGKDSKIIIFAETKKDCNELAVSPSIKLDCQVLHGDIAQGQRETTMKAFREGKVRVLIATDVAARGLDMIVDLVINYEPPRTQGGRPNVDTYVHRSGRTGRAGRKGICITLYSQKQEYNLIQIERTIGNKFLIKEAPDRNEMIQSAGDSAMAEVKGVDDKMVSLFKEKAEELLLEKNAADLLSAALACIAGYSKPLPKVSLQNGAPDWVTVLFKSSAEIRAKGYVWNVINRDFPESIANEIKMMNLCADKKGACFDIPMKTQKELEALFEKQGSNCQFTIPDTIPALQPQQNRSYGGGNGGGGYGGQQRRGGYGGGNRSARGNGGGGGGRRY